MNRSVESAAITPREIRVLLSERGVVFEDGRAPDGDSLESWASTIEGRTVVTITQPLTKTRLDLLRQATLPSFVSAVAVATLLSRDGEAVAVVEVDVLEPARDDLDIVAIAAARAALDASLSDFVPDEYVVRVLDQVFRVVLVFDGATRSWSGTASRDGSSEREAGLWRLFRSFSRSERWAEHYAAWGPDGFRIEDNPRAIATEVAVFSIGGLELGVIPEALAHDQLEQLARSPLPAWLDAIAATTLVAQGSTTMIDVALIAPPSIALPIVAAGVACATVGTGVFAQMPEQFLIRFARESLFVAVEFDGETQMWTARTRPQAGFSSAQIV